MGLEAVCNCVSMKLMIWFLGRGEEGTAREKARDNKKPFDVLD